MFYIDIFDNLGVPLHEQKMLSEMAVDTVMGSVFFLTLQKNNFIHNEQ